MSCSLLLYAFQASFVDIAPFLIVHAVCTMRHLRILDFFIPSGAKEGSVRNKHLRLTHFRLPSGVRILVCAWRHSRISHFRILSGA